MEENPSKPRVETSRKLKDKYSTRRSIEVDPSVLPAILEEEEKKQSAYATTNKVNLRPLHSYIYEQEMSNVMMGDKSPTNEMKSDIQFNW